VAFLAAVVLADLAAIAAGVLIAAHFRYDTSVVAFHLTRSGSGPAFVLLTAVVWVAVLSARAAYAPPTLISGTRQLLRVSGASVLAWVAMILLAIWIKVPVPFESRLVMGVSLPACVVFLVLTRLLLVRPAARRVYRRLCRGPILVLADAAESARILQQLEEDGVRDALVVAQPFESLEGRNVRGFVEERGFREVIIAPDAQTPGEILTVAFACLDAGAPVRLVAPDFRGLARALGSELSEMQLRRFDLDGPERILKRAIDLFGAAVGVVVLAPLFAGIALAIRLTSRGPVFFRQERIGLRGRRFLMNKFRTMQHGNDSGDYEAYVRSFILEGRPAEVTADGVEIFKPKSDPRVTRVGGWLRKLSLDELPQLWNVLLGDMSLVGPRPCLPCEWDLYQPWQRRRFDVIPGCTGLWQVAGRSRVRFDDMVILDLYYAHHGTVLTDLRLIAQTGPVMLFGHGAY
jgi:exopolysaccharide biosynthesis polyprenyl glycosylphosphotransferase